MISVQVSNVHPLGVLGLPTLRKLMWPIYIVRTNGDQRQLEATPVCADHHLCRCFTRRVWICWGQYACLAQVCRSDRYIAVYLIGRDVYKSIDTMFPRSFKQNMCAIYIGVGELV